MSVEAMSWALNAPVGNPHLKLILIAYANHADRHGQGAYISVATAAHYAGCSKRTVQRSVAALVEAGWMTEGDPDLVVRNTRIPGNRRPKVYDLAITRRDDSVAPL